MNFKVIFYLYLLWKLAIRLCIGSSIFISNILSSTLKKFICLNQSIVFFIFKWKKKVTVWYSYLAYCWYFCYDFAISNTSGDGDTFLESRATQ
jgi:hypothetical protein